MFLISVFVTQQICLKLEFTGNVCVLLLIATFFVNIKSRPAGGSVSPSARSGRATSKWVPTVIALTRHRIRGILQHRHQQHQQRHANNIDATNKSDANNTTAANYNRDDKDENSSSTVAFNLQSAKETQKKNFFLFLKTLFASTW